MNNLSLTKHIVKPAKSSDEAQSPSAAPAPRTAPKSLAQSQPAKKSVSASAPTPTKKTAAGRPVAKVLTTTEVAKVVQPAPQPSAPKKAAKQGHAVAKAEHNIKLKKEKLVRDSFTMPESEYQVLADAKKECLKVGVAIKKSELLRVSVAGLKLLSVAQLTAARDGLTKLQTGRPKK